jgi:hypothetical protein
VGGRGIDRPAFGQDPRDFSLRNHPLATGRAVRPQLPGPLPGPERFDPYAEELRSLADPIPIHRRFILQVSLVKMPLEAPPEGEDVR